MGLSHGATERGARHEAENVLEAVGASRDHQTSRPLVGTLTLFRDGSEAASRFIMTGPVPDAGGLIVTRMLLDKFQQQRMRRLGHTAMVKPI